MFEASANNAPPVVIDLFSGRDGAATLAFADAGWERYRVELSDKCEAEIHADILTLTAGDLPQPDFIWASPPCEKHSIMSAGHYWLEDDYGFLPTTPESIHHTNLAMHALYLIAAMKPKGAILENPRGMMRKILPVKPHATVWYCRYGDTRAKPTDLWCFGAARQFYFEPECKNGHTDHEASPRGSRTGTQTPMSYHERSLVPYALSKSVQEQMDAYLAGELVPGRLAV